MWHVARPLPERARLAGPPRPSARRAARWSSPGEACTTPAPTDALAAFCEATGIPVGQSQAGKGTLAFDHPQCLGAIGSTGTSAANTIARDADVVIGIGTRYSDFTTASRTAFQAAGVRFVNVNVAGSGRGQALRDRGRRRRPRDPRGAHGRARAVAASTRSYVARVPRLDAEWEATVHAAYHPSVPAAGADGLLTQGEVIGMVNELTDPRDVVVCAAGSMPGDLHKLWQTRDPKGYHVEYGYSCMGYEVAGGVGVAMACPDRDVVVMVGDGSYLMMATELVTAVQEHVKVITVLVQNHGYASIGALSEELGSQRFGTRYRYRVRLRPARRRAAARRPRRERRVARRAGAARRGPPTSSPPRCGRRKAADDERRRPRRDRPAGARPGLPLLVGRPGRRGGRRSTPPSAPARPTTSSRPRRSPSCGRRPPTPR